MVQNSHLEQPLSTKIYNQIINQYKIYKNFGKQSKNKKKDKSNKSN